MGFRTLLNFPHLLKPLCLIFLFALLIILWENRQYPSTKLTSWQVLPLLLIIWITIWADQSVNDPEWAYLEVISCSIMATMSVWNSLTIWQLEARDANTYLAMGVSTFLAVVWTFQLVAYGLAACFDFWDFAKEEQALEEARKKPIRSLSAQLSGGFLIEEEVLEEVTYREYRYTMEDEEQPEQVSHFSNCQ